MEIEGTCETCDLAKITKTPVLKQNENKHRIFVKGFSAMLLDQSLHQVKMGLDTSSRLLTNTVRMLV